MKRRQLFCNTAAIIGAAGLARPRIARAASASTLKFVPYADLALLDPLVSAFVTRNHVMMVFDTLFALDANGDAQPQMLAGHTVEDGAKTWRLTLRDGLLFHDGSKVLARDVVASLRRGWSNRRWIWCRHWADCGLIRRHEVSLMCGRLRPTYWRKRSPRLFHTVSPIPAFQRPGWGHSRTAANGPIPPSPDERPRSKHLVHSAA